MYGTLLYAAASCIMIIGPFGAYLNTQIVARLGYLRYAAAGMAVWMIYILGARKKRLFQWVYTAITILFTGAALSTIQPGAFGSLPAIIVTGIPVSTAGLKILSVWVITALLFILPNTHDIKLSGIKDAFGNLKPDMSNGFSFFVPAAAPALSGEPQSERYKPIPFVRFGSLAGDKAFMKNSFTFPIGQREDGKPLFAELCDDTPHFLIAGMTGSGKTVFLQTAIAALAYKNMPADLQLILIDGVQRGFKPFTVLPHVIHDGVLFEEPDVVKALRYAYNNLKERIRNDVCAPKIVTVIDDIDDFFAGKMGAEIQMITSYIVKKGRQFGVHIIIGSQRPSGDLVSVHTLSQMKRICLKVELPKYSKNIIEKPDGASLTGKGDLLYLLDGDLIHARGYYMDEKGKGEVSNFAAGVAGMYPLAQKLLGAAPDADTYGYDDDGCDLESLPQFLRADNVVSYPGKTPDVRTDSRTAPDTQKSHDTAERTMPDSVRGRTADGRTTVNTYKTWVYTDADTGGQTTDDTDIKAKVIALHKRNMSSRTIAPIVGIGKTKAAEIIKKYEDSIAE